MRSVAEPIHLNQLWDMCRAANWNMRIHRVNPTANGINDQFVLSVSPSGFDTAAMEVKTTNLESAATLILDRHPQGFPDA